jgi:proteasome lid subunit RPN8/RPN11
MRREVCYLIGVGDAVLWSDASDSPVALPDSRARWQAIWARRDEIVEIAHSHPVGPLAFSREDETTMAALVSALGRAVVFSVVAPRGMIRRSAAYDGDIHVGVEPLWALALRHESGM